VVARSSPSLSVISVGRSTPPRLVAASCVRPIAVVAVSGAVLSWSPLARVSTDAESSGRTVTEPEPAAVPGAIFEITPSTVVCHSATTRRAFASLAVRASSASAWRTPLVAHTTTMTVPMPRRTAATSCTQRRTKNGGLRTTGAGRGARAAGRLLVLPLPLMAMPATYFFRRRITMIAAS
jgi:hypothetical protein